MQAPRFLPVMARHRGVPRRQRGAIAIMVGFSIVVLVLVLGVVVDLGHLYVAKTELQNAADACALSAVRELSNRSGNVLERATNAAITVGARNRVNYQGDPVPVLDANVTFSESLAGSYTRAIGAATRYVRCELRYEDLGIRRLYFIPAARGFLGREASVAWEMRADAVARLVPGQTVCAIPLTICSTNPDAANAGLTVGEWYSGRVAAGTGITGNYNWIRLTEDQRGANDLAKLLTGEGQCETSDITTVDEEPGVNQNVSKAWNTRFGLYNDPDDRFVALPDWTGWAYTPTSWTTPGFAYTNFLSHRYPVYDPYQGDLLSGINLPKNLQSQRAWNAAGTDRRVVAIPITQCKGVNKDIRVEKWACVLMLAPIVDPLTDVKLEFLGLANESASPCVSAGFPGGSGALVPALAQ